MTVEGAGVLLGSLLVVAVVAAIGRDGPNGDQQMLNLLVVRELDPSAFATDAVLGREYHRFYIPGFPKVQAIIVKVWGGDPTSALRVLLWPTGILYLVGHYVFFRGLAGSWLPAALASVAAITVRNTLGGDYWGFDGVPAVQARSIGSAVIPPLLLLFVRARSGLGLAFFFGLAGVLANVHPVSGLHLLQAGSLAHLWVERWRWRAWAHVVLGAAAFVVGALPFLLQYVPTRDPVTDPSLLAEVRAAVQYRFPYLLYPIGLETIISVTLHAAFLLVVLAWLWRTHGLPSRLRALLAVGVAAVVAGLGGAAVVQLVASLTNGGYLDIQQLRAVRLVYPVLLGALAIAYARILARRSARTLAVALVVCLLSTVPAAALIHSVDESRRIALKRALGLAVPAYTTVPRAATSAAVFDELAAWVRKETPPDARFLTDSFDFRAATLRGTTGSFKDGGIMWLAGTRPFLEWYHYIEAVDGCRRRRGEGCWFELARAYGADFVVVDPEIPAAAAPPGFERLWHHAGWSVWRRGETR